ncbi:protein Rep [Fictibacillus sp. Mic-4]|uniref:rolling circle replication-associated protein n=1 Tax=Fictibacillus sp. Mic-4 TaxID=3132826 RepID=UPI003CE88DD1
MGYLKLIKTGHVIEVYQYEKDPVIPDFDIDDDDNYLVWCPIEQKMIDLTPEWLRECKNKTKESYTRSNSVRCRNMIRRLCLANFDNKSKFVTLTFAENMQCLDTAHKQFKQFIQRMRYKYGTFKYIAVIEFQKRGAIHYHMMSDLPYIPNEKLAKIWRHGFVRINNISKVDNVGAYMVKYMLKDVEDDRLAGRKAYLYSKGLTRPEVFKNDDAWRIVKENDLENKKIVFTNSYISEYLGEVVYAEYNLKRH